MGTGESTMNYGSKPLPLTGSSSYGTGGVDRPDGLTEAISGFYNGFLVLVFVLVSIAMGCAFVWFAYQYATSDYEAAKAAAGFGALITGLMYLAFVLSVGLIATFLSMRRHLVYQSSLLERLLRAVGR
jgi:TRAP-type C4-dicarboxylate transport system permease small subunit